MMRALWILALSTFYAWVGCGGEAIEPGSFAAGATSMITGGTSTNAGTAGQATAGTSGASATAGTGGMPGGGTAGSGTAGSGPAGAPGESGATGSP